MRRAAGHRKDVCVMEYKILLLIVFFIFLILYTVLLVHILRDNDRFARKAYIRRKKEILHYAELIELTLSADMVDFIMEKPPCETRDMLALLAGYRDGNGETPPTLGELEKLYQRYFEEDG